MAATKRNAGLTSAVPRATLNDEELVCIFSSNTWMVHLGNVLCRRFERPNSVCVKSKLFVNQNQFSKSSRMRKNLENSSKIKNTHIAVSI